jgi:hypothetical protein
MQAGSRDRREGDTGALNQVGFHAALAANPQHGLRFTAEGL